MRRISLIAVIMTAGSLHALEYHVAKIGSDTNAGSAKHPFLTIQRAADVAQPGDVITVHEGICRERGNPPRDGTPYRIDTDYSGNNRNADNPVAGPFHGLEKESVRLKVWPKP